MQTIFQYPNVSNYQELMQYNNTITNNMFGPVLLLIIFMVCFIATKGNRYSTGTAFTFASFTTMISSTMLAIIGIVSSEIILFLIIIVAISLFFLQKDNQ